MAIEEEARTLEGILIEPVIEFDRKRLDVLLGVFAAVFVGIPVAFALGTSLVVPSILVALGSFNLYLGQGILAPPTRLRVAAVACLLDAVGIAVGTLVAASGPWEIPLIALAVAAFQLALFLPHSRSVALSSTAVFAIAFGLPLGTSADALSRALLILLGGGWGLVGSALEWQVRRRLVARSSHGSASRWVRGPLAPTALPPLPPRTVIALAVTLGVSAATAYGIAVGMGLPRNYWAILSVIVVLQSGLLATLSMAVVRVGGTSVGAAIGGYLSIVITAPWAVGLLVAGLVGGALAVRNANRAVYVVFLTPFVLVVLSIAYPAGWSLATDRILDTLVGGSVALLAGFVMWLALRATAKARPRAPS